MKKIILLITTFLTAFVLVILGIVGTLSVRSKSETDSQCTIEKIEKYEIKDASYNFTKLDGMIKKYEIQVKGLLTFYLDGEKIENNEEHFFHTSDDEFFKNVMEHSDQYGLYEVTVSINNRSNEMMFDVGCILDSERHAVIETDFAVEGISVGAKKDGQFSFVVLTDKPDLSEEQVKNLLISDGLKLTYQTESGADIHNNEIHIK